jgi:hypothetical protein
MVKNFPKNQIKYIVDQKWDDKNSLESAITDYFYKENKGLKPTKTDDLVLLFVLGIDKKAKKPFLIKFDSWKKTKDANLVEELTKLFFISSLASKNLLKKEAKYFLENTSDSDFGKELKSIHIFLKLQYLNKNGKVKIERENSVLSLVARLYTLYNNGKVRDFYESQIELIDLISKQRLNTYEKIILLLYSENDQFRGLQLNRRDSIAYLKNKDYPLFYEFIKQKYLESLFNYKIWIIPFILGLFTILRSFGLLDFSTFYEGSFFKVEFLPILIEWASVPLNLFVLFLISVIGALSIITIKFLKELKKQ